MRGGVNVQSALCLQDEVPRCPRSRSVKANARQTLRVIEQLRSQIANSNLLQQLESSSMGASSRGSTISRHC
jgi:hypothetical protein